MKWNRTSVHCGLTAEREVDYHIRIGFEAPSAQDRATLTDVVHYLSGRPDHKFKRNDRKEDGLHPFEQKAYVVEMTPHYRARFYPDSQGASKWTVQKLWGAVGLQVKIVGQLLADDAHNNGHDNCADPNADPEKCWRASIWEIHPVTHFYVCPSGSCSENSPNWQKLADR